MADTENDLWQLVVDGRRGVLATLNDDSRPREGTKPRS
jgi:hypothetical protein